MKLKKLLTKLPVVSYLSYVTKGRNKDREKGISENVQTLKGVVHLAYALIPLYATTYFSITGAFTKEWNPFKQPEARRQHTQLRLEQGKKQAELIESHNLRYDDLYRKLFIKPAYADKDKNKIISFEEQVDVWRRKKQLRVMKGNNFYSQNFLNLQNVNFE